MKLLVKKLFRLVPSGLRLRAVRFWQDQFTVSAAAVVFNSEGKVLLLDHVLRPYSGWGLPGGFIDHGEEPEAAVRRELMEETGLELSEVEMLRVRIVGRHVEVLFTAHAVGEAEVKSREILGLGWFSGDELPDGLSSAQAKLIRAAVDARV